MHFDTEGTYTLQYTATDSCGNETIEERTVEVVELHTTLFADGTFIINEKSTDRDANIALHGAVTRQYTPLSPTASVPSASYIFASMGDRPWNGQMNAITAVEIGSPIKPRSTAWWFRECSNLASVDLSLMDTENTTDMAHMFSFCQSLASIDVSHFNTSNVTDMAGMFGYCSSLRSLDLSSFDTSKVEKMLYMFQTCTLLESLDVSSFNTSIVTLMYGMFNECSTLTSLDVSSFDTSNVTNFNSMFQSCSALTTIYASNLFAPTTGATGNNMFASCGSLVGGAGTTTSGNPINATYARIDNPPDAPGYFTAKA